MKHTTENDLKLAFKLEEDGSQLSKILNDWENLLKNDNWFYISNVQFNCQSYEHYLDFITKEDPNLKENLAHGLVI